MEVLKFFFDSGWHFAGLVVVMILIAEIVAVARR